MTRAEVLVGLLGDFLPAELLDFMEGLGEDSCCGVVSSAGDCEGTGAAATGVGTSSSGGESSSLGMLGGRLTMAAVKAILCCDEVKVAVHVDEYCTVSFTGLANVGITECGAGKGAPKAGGNIAGPVEGNAREVFKLGGGNKLTGLTNCDVSEKEGNGSGGKGMPCWR